jgi:hypothetical protein
MLTWAAAAVLPALLVSAAGIGCSGDNKSETKAEDKTTTGGTKGGKGGPLTAVESTGKGTLKGKVKFAGARPSFTTENEAMLKQMKDKDEAHCLVGASQAEKEQLAWRISDDGGVQNVFVWLQPPAGKFFKIEEKDVPADLKHDQVLDQPHCAFIPHAFVLFPSYRDAEKPKEFKPTGQKLIVKNSADTNHNTKFQGGVDNQALSKDAIVPAKDQWAPMTLNPSAKEIGFECSIHPWMRAYARVFDHPYATVTKADGTYEIKDVPAGAEVHVVIWHEKGGYGAGKDGKKVTLKPEVNPEDFEIKPE